MNIGLIIENGIPMKRIIILFLLYLFCPAPGEGQEAVSEFSAPGIRTVKLHRTEWNLSYPLISLNGEEQLVLFFDQLGERVNTFYYTFVHCDKDWYPSDIFTTDYLDGFAENRIEEYRMSFNTTVNYVNYSVTFPNDDVRFKLSGNYIVKVYEMGEPDNPVLIKRFMVSEKAVAIRPELQRSKLTSGYNTDQQVDFTADHAGFNIIDPNRNLFATILQNGRWDNARRDIKPDFIRSNELVYNDISGKCTFPGGDEFRYFDIKSLRYHTEYVRSVEYFEGIYQVYLQPSESRLWRQYFYWQDFNGKFFTAFQEGRDPEIEADYVNVYFTLPSDFPVKERDVYVYGALSGWTANDDNRMFYNYQDHRYELTLMLKQGWYNYIFAVADKRGNILPEQHFESDHFETENDYTILLYYRNPSDRYDRLIGDRSVNTLTR